MPNDLVPVKAKVRNLTDEVAETLKGKSIHWWRAKIRSYLARIRELMILFEDSERQRREAIEAGEGIQARLGQSEAAAASLTAELAESNRNNQELQATIETLDVDAVFERMVEGWEQEIIVPLEKELGV